MTQNNTSGSHPAEAATQSPYAPPRAAVSDIASQMEVPPRPPAVTRAVKCLWACFVMSVIGTLWAQATMRGTVTNVAPESMGGLANLQLVFLGLALLLSIWMYRAIGKGRNWARILLFIFAVLSLVSLPGYFQAVNSGVFSLAQGALTLLNYGVTFYACYLLLKQESREWFRAVKEARR